MGAKRLFGLPYAVFVAAVVIGIVLASYDNVLRLVTTGVWFDAPSENSQLTTAGVPGSGHGASGLTSGNAQAGDQSQIARTITMEPIEYPLIRTGNGVVMVGHLENGEFVGYRVIEGGEDGRLIPDNVIVAINGTPVDGSAAGSELLIAALVDSTAQVDLVPVKN